MKTFYQCLGITGVILFLYGLLAFAITQASTPFFWGLLISGALFTGIFVWKSLSREWQATVGAFVGLNISWILLSAGRSGTLWPMAIGCVVVLALIGISLIKRVPLQVLMGTIIVVGGSYAALWYFRDKSWYKFGVLGGAFVYNAILIYLSRLLLGGVVKTKSLQQSSSAVVYTVVVISIICVANVLSSDQHKQWDLTENKVSKLSDQSVKVIKNLTKPIQITVFMDDRNQLKPQVKNLLETYRYETKNVEFKFLDPDKDKQLAVENKVKDGDILVEYNGQKNVTTDGSEEGITQAVLKVAKTTSATVCFTKGHGELDLDGKEDEPRSLSGIKGGLINEGYIPQGVPSIAVDVPLECQMLVIAGAIQAFTKEEASSFDRYLEKGGKAIVLTDPNVLDPRLNPKVAILDNGLEKVLQKWGVDLGKNFILEKHLKLLQGVQVEASVMAQTYGDHPLVDPLKGKNTVFHAVRSVQKRADFKGTSVVLISSAGDGGSWGETDVATLVKTGKAEVGSGDFKGPVPIAVAVEKENSDNVPKTQLVVFGDSDFVSNALVRSYEFNFDLFLNALSWLQGDVEKISIRPKKIRTSAIELSPEQSMTILNVALIGIPMLVLIFGMDLWWWRKRRG